MTKDNWMEVDQAAYVAMLENLDSETGRLLRAVDEAGVDENTVVSDWTLAINRSNGSMTLRVILGKNRISQNQMPN